MFFTYAEKQKGRLFGEWQMREIAFDSMRRYFYYSESDLPPSLCAETQPSAVVSLVSSPTGGAGVFPTTDDGRVSSNRSFAKGSDPTKITWKAKIKVDEIDIVAIHDHYSSEDPSRHVLDYYQVYIGGELRALAHGETPSPGPLLCPSTGFEVDHDRFSDDNTEYIEDPFYLRELYEALRDQFRDMKREREQLELTTGKKRKYQFQTLESPRKSVGFSFKSSRVRHAFRMRSEYELQRFYYVVKSVLGYDKLCERPLSGLPPYDPRNNLIYAFVPLPVWDTFKKMSQCVFYSFVRGSCYGRSSGGEELTTTVHDCFLCISNESILVLRLSGTIPMWALLREVHSFYYNDTCPSPYVAILTDHGPPNIVFEPKPSPYMQPTHSTSNPVIDVRRISNVIQAGCFQSVHVRRVIQCEKASEVSALDFIRAYESQHNTVLNFKFELDYPSGAADCPWPREDLMTIWQDMRTLYATRGRNTDGQAAIPIYENNTNNPELQPDQLPELSRRLARERTAVNDIVGIAYEEMQRVSALSRAQSMQNVSNTATTATGGGLQRRQSVANGWISFNASRNQRGSSTGEESDTSHHSDPLEPPSTPPAASSPLGDDDSGPNDGIDNFQFADSSDDDERDSSDSDHNPYSIKGSRYFTADEMRNNDDSFQEVIVENHSVLEGSKSRTHERKVSTTTTTTST